MESSEDIGAGRKKWVCFASASFYVAGYLKDMGCGSSAGKSISECCGKGRMSCSHPSVRDRSIRDIDLDCATDINKAIQEYIYLYLYLYL